MRKPDFLIIGAMKGGTTLLYDGLRQHPEVFMPFVKESHFFSVVGEDVALVPLEGAQVRISLWQEYLDLFKDSLAYRVAGEASTSYLYTSRAARKIKERLGNAKIICILRNPINRAYSHYLWLRRLGLESAEEFKQALMLESSRIESKCDFGRYVQIGRYYQQLETYFELFDLQKIHVVYFDDIKYKSASLMEGLYEFLNLEMVDFHPDLSVRRNPSGEPRLHWIDHLFKRRSFIKQALLPLLPRSIYLWLSRIRDWNLVKPPMDPDVRKYLIDVYADEISKLETLVNRDLSNWMQ